MKEQSSWANSHRPSLDQAMDRVELRGLSMDDIAVNIFNHKPAVVDDVPDVYEDSGRRMAVSDETNEDEPAILREILRQVEQKEPPPGKPPNAE